MRLIIAQQIIYRELKRPADLAPDRIQLARDMDNPTIIIFLKI
jgi:hypothetical protein